MTVLYRRDGQSGLHFHRAWFEGDVVVERRGRVGTGGEERRSTGADADALARVVAAARDAGFETLAPDALRTLVIELPIQGRGCDADVARCAALREHLATLLDRTGLGDAVEGATRPGAMVVVCRVVDLDVAQRCIHRALLGTEFDDYESVA